MVGEEQEEKARPSRLHSNVAPSSVAAKANVAVRLLVTAGGCWTSSVPGARESTVQVCSAAVASAFPASSRASARSVCLPARRPERTRGDEHVANAAPSSEQRKETPDSVATRSKLAVLPVRPRRAPI